jgi:hypothetical protein
MVHGGEIWLELVEIQQDLYINLQSYLYLLQHNSATTPAATHPTREPLLQIYLGHLTLPLNHNRARLRLCLKFSSCRTANALVKPSAT